MCIGVLGAEFDRLSVLHHRILQAALPIKQDSQIVVRLRVIGLDLQSMLEALCGFLRSSSFDKAISEIVVSHPAIRIAMDRGLIKFDSVAVHPGLPPAQRCTGGQQRHTRQRADPACLRPKSRDTDGQSRRRQHNQRQAGQILQMVSRKREHKPIDIQKTQHRDQRADKQQPTGQRAAPSTPQIATAPRTGHGGQREEPLPPNVGSTFQRGYMKIRFAGQSNLLGRTMAPGRQSKSVRTRQKAKSAPLRRHRCVLPKR